jgi:hypothetical protein
MQKGRSACMLQHAAQASSLWPAGSQCLSCLGNTVQTHCSSHASGKAREARGTVGQTGNGPAAHLDHVLSPVPWQWLQQEGLPAPRHGSIAPAPGNTQIFFFLLFKGTISGDQGPGSDQNLLLLICNFLFLLWPTPLPAYLPCPFVLDTPFQNSPMLSFPLWPTEVTKTLTPRSHSLAPGLTRTNVSAYLSQSLNSIQRWYVN